MIDDARPPYPRLDVHDLGFSYGSSPALRSVTLELHPGKHYIVAGPNGAGKSTFLDLLANLKRPHTGGVRVAGRALADFTTGELAKVIALAPQEYQLDFSFTVREIVAMGRRPYLDRWGRLGNDDAAAVLKALGDMHLEAIADKSVLALSGGEKRRCIVARALAQTTPVLLLDEPCSGLDISQALSVMTLARNLAESGALVVTISHDLNLAARYGHELVFLKNGRLAAAGPVERVFTDSILSDLYEADAHVAVDPVTDSPMVSFRLHGMALDDAVERHNRGNA